MFCIAVYGLCLWGAKPNKLSFFKLVLLGMGLQFGYPLIFHDSGATQIQTQVFTGNRYFFFVWIRSFQCSSSYSNNTKQFLVGAPFKNICKIF